MKKIVFFIFLMFFITPVMANDLCREYIEKPEINVLFNDVNIVVKQPDYSFQMSHGNMATQLASSYSFSIKTIPIPSGYCMVLEKLNLNIKYADFIINIDKKYVPDSCAYNYILAHEKRHVDAFSATMQKRIPDIKNKLTDVVKNIEPVYIFDYSEFAIAEDKLLSGIKDAEPVKNLFSDIFDDIENINSEIDSDPESENKKIKECLRDDMIKQ